MNDRAMTHLSSKELAQQGKWPEAWAEAQKDEGLLEGVTFENWKKWMEGLLVLQNRFTGSQ